MARTKSTDELIYLGALTVGTTVPFAVVIPWFVAHGLDVGLFLDQLFATSVSTFFALDVVITVCIVVVMAVRDPALAMKGKVAAGAASLLGASVGLPMYLWLSARAQRKGGGVED